MPRAVARPPRPLWTCPRCAAQFIVANSYHSCGRFSLDDLFVRADPHVRPLFDRLRAMVREAGDATLIPQKTRAVFMTRMRFINVQIRRSSLVVGFILRRRPTSSRFFKVETFSPRSHAAYLRIESLDDLDAGVRRYIRRAHETGSYDVRRHRRD